jgi:hypothetical protein
MAEQIRLAIQQVGSIRTENVWGREWRVFPAVLVREQVLGNNLGATFLPAEEIAASTEAWNAIPVVVRHPTRRGAPISARHPAILDRTGVGFLFRARFAGNALKADVFLDPSRIEAVEDAGRAVQNVEEGRPSELSTGFVTNVELAQGTFDGREFKAILRNIRPDHLALLPDEVGACSVADGCGLGVNHSGECRTPDDAVRDNWWMATLAAVTEAQPTNQEAPVDEETQGRLANVLDKLTAFLSRATPPESETAEEPESPEEEAATNSEEGDSDMNRDQMIAHLAEAGPLGREALNKLSDCQLQALAGAKDGGTGGANNQDGGDSPAWQVAHDYRRKYEELKAQTATAVENEERERARLLDDILYAQNRAYSDDEVEAMGIVELRKLHQTMFPPERSYAGRGGPRASNAGGDFTFVRSVLGPNSVLSEEVN